MPPSLRVGPDGNVVIQPVNGVVLLALEYMDHPEQLESGAREQLQATLSPQQAMEIALALTLALRKLAEPPEKPGILLQ